MLKTLSTESAEPRKSGIGVGSDSKAGYDRKKLDRSEVYDDEVDGGKVKDNEVEKKGQNLFKSKNLSKSKKTVGSDFLTPKTRLAFTKLRQPFVKALILHHFNPEYYIWVDTNELGYTISEVIS